MNNEEQIWSDYRNWLTNLALDWLKDYGSYRYLVDYLYSSKFVPPTDRDWNREADGRDVRMRFAEAFDYYNYKSVFLYLYNAPCSMLEMLVGLSMRIEQEIMWDPDEDKTSTWFYDMLRSSHLSDLDDYHWDSDRAASILEMIFSRTYEPNGDGGLFTVKRCSDDMRRLELWYQCNRYLNEVLGIN